jgi:hypothetical protein
LARLRSRRPRRAPDDGGRRLRFARGAHAVQPIRRGDRVAASASGVWRAAVVFPISQLGTGTSGTTPTSSGRPTDGWLCRAVLSPSQGCRAQSWSCSPSTSSSGESNSPHETGSGGSQRRRRDRDGVPVDRDAAIWTITGAPRDGGLRHEGVARGEGGDQCSAPQLMTTSLMLGVRLSAGEPSPAAALEAIGFVPTDPVLDRYGLRVCDSFDRWSAGFRWGTCPQRAW